MKPILLAALLLALPCCATPAAGSTQGISVVELSAALGRVEATLVHLRAAAVTAGVSDPQVDRIAGQLAEVTVALARITASADINGDGVLGGNGANGGLEWLSFLGAVGMDLTQRIAALQAKPAAEPHP